MSIERIRTEKEQTPEEIRSVLETAWREGRAVDLVILDSGGVPRPVPDLLVEEMEGDDLMMTYIAEDGDVGELIPLSLRRVKRAELRKEDRL